MHDYLEIDGQPKKNHWRNMENFIAIDPGKNGGIAYKIDGETGCMKIGETLGDIWTQLNVLKMKANASKVTIEACILEIVHAMPKQGISSAWTFAEQYGAIKGMLVAAAIPAVLWTPVFWQKTIGASRPSSKGMTPAQKEKTKAEAKRKIKELVQGEFPHLMKEITLATADALGMLIAARKISEKPTQGETNG